MKIAYDPQIFCLQTYGGVSRYFCEVAAIISKSKLIQVRLVAPLYVCQYFGMLPGEIVYGFKAPNFKPFRNILRIIGITLGHLYLLLIRPKIIHETYFFPFALGAKGAIRVLTVYDMIHEKFPSENFFGDQTSKYKQIAVRRADHIICISEATKRDLIEWFHVDPNKISVIYLGYKESPIKRSSICQIKNKLPNNFLLYVGQRGGYKNFEGLLAAYADSKKIQSECDLVCFGGNSFGPNEYQMIQKMGVAPEKIIHFGGGDDVLYLLYQKAAAFIYPSKYEGFGIPPLEAMGNNCPVICSKAGSIPEVVGAAGEYFNPCDLEDIKNAIEKVVFDPNRRAELVQLGRAQVKLFTWDRCAEETSQLYSTLASKMT